MQAPDADEAILAMAIELATGAGALTQLVGGSGESRQHQIVVVLRRRSIQAAQPDGGHDLIG